MTTDQKYPTNTAFLFKDRPGGREKFWCYRFSPIDSRHDITKTRRGPLHPSRDSLTGTHPRD